MTFTENTEGVFFGLPESVYRPAPGINISSLKAISRSPAHYLAGIAEKKPATPAMIFGTVLHGAILEPERVLHVVKPDGMTFTTKEGKAWRDGQSLPILSADENRAVEGCKASICRHKTAREIINRSKTEVAVFKRDSETGLMLKGRIDCLFSDDHDRTTIADIKTTDDASEAEFSRKIFNFGYAEQAAFYFDLLGASFFLFVAVEKEGPFAVNVFNMQPESIEVGRRNYRRWLNTLAECISKGEYPAYGNGINEVGLPAWVLKREGME